MITCAKIAGMTTQQETRRKPGTLTTTLGLCLAGLSLLLVILIVSGGGSATVFTIGGIFVGLVIAGIGFARRVLAALEKR